MKIALACSGVGRELRGFEAFTESLYGALRQYAPHIDATLFQGAGLKNAHRITVPSLGRYDVPARVFGTQKAYMLETRSFGMALYPLLRRGRYDVVHYSDLLTGSVLFHLRRNFGGRFKLLYCNGAPSPPVHYHHRCDAAQLLTGPHYEEAVAFGIGEERLFLIPYGVDAEMFSPDVSHSRLKIRSELGIPENAKVILTVAALKREHKRVDHLLREIAQLNNSLWLVAAGQKTEETDSLREEAERYLPGRWRFLSWPRERMHLLYTAADAFSLGSLTEGFGLVIVEAMLSGLPILVHDAPVFRWIAGHSDVRCINMAKQGALAMALTEILTNGSCSNSRGEGLERFSWERLVGQYLKMYQQVAEAAFGKVRNGK